MIEVLSPAGSPDAAKAAINGGADAVYLGYGDFNARRNAKNFTLDELRETVALCHASKVAVHAALNTLVFPGEERRALKTAKEAAEAGVDAFIVQDLGLAALLHKELPDIPLHASTQLSVHNVSGAKFCAEAGFTRVVLAREMSKQEIIAVHEALPEAELEVFVHGALCMSVSGQCWFSAFLGGRSGNRGLCAQTCRLPFTCAGRENALSLKDLSLVSHVKELAEAGVSSLKIEGRMKRPEYVAISSRAVRYAVDGVKDEEVESLLRGVFSRSGFTDGYYQNRRTSEMFGVRTKEDAPPAGAFGQINALTRTVCPRLPLAVTLTAHRGEPLTLTLTCGEETVTVKGDVPQEAKTKQDCSRVRETLTRFGGTPYFAKTVTLDADESLFLPASVINDLRRRAVEKFAWHKPVSSTAVFPERETEGYAPTKFVLRAENAEGLPKSEHYDIWLPLASLTEEVVASLKGHRVAAELPRFLPAGTEKMTVERLREAKSWGVFHAVCGNVSHIPLALEAGLTPLGAFGLNDANGFTDAFLREAGVAARTLSFEVPYRLLSSFAGSENLLFAYGRIPVMLTRACPLSGKNGCGTCTAHGGTLTDRKGEHFPVLCRKGHAEIVNSRPLWLADKDTGDLPRLLYFTTETAEEAEKVLEAYERQQPCEGVFTRGLYFK